MTPQQKTELREFIPETLLYAALVAAFCVGVVRLLGHPLAELFHHHRVGYAVVALALMIGQGFVLERATHALCAWLRRDRKAAR